MTKKISYLLSCLMLLLVASCGVKGLRVVEVQIPTDVPDPAKPPEEFYVIGPGDLLSVVVWKDPSVSGQFKVRPDGFITLPLVNEVQVTGMSTEELRKILVEKYKVFIKNPFVTIGIKEIVSSVVYVIGEVEAPMAYPAFGKDTVLQLLTRAGGLTIFAKRHSIRVIRRNGTKATTYIVDYDAIIKGDFKQDILLRPGDRIIVP